MEKNPYKVFMAPDGSWWIGRDVHTAVPLGPMPRRHDAEAD